MARRNTTTARGGQELPAPFIFALIFTALFLAHATVLRLPYFWDEAGYFVPAARDLLLTGDFIPHTTLSNAHPPLVMAWLAMWWKLSAFTPAVTRTAMLLVAASGFTALYLLARRFSGVQVAIATVVLTAVSPTVFSQSAMAQLDIAAFTLVLWTLYFHLTDRRWMAVGAAALGGIAKETTIVVPLTLCAIEILRATPWAARLLDDTDERCDNAQIIRRALAYVLALVPLLLWYAYHFHRTGHVFGNPDYLRYNVGATVTPLRIAVAILLRLWHAFGYMNMFVLTAAAMLALQVPAATDRPTLPRRVLLVFVAVLGMNVLEFSVVGGALLARYMIPMIPLVVYVCVDTLARRIQAWRWWAFGCGVVLLTALLYNPPWRIAPEDNMAWTDYVRLHKAAATYVQQHYSEDRILTAWPASDEIDRPFLGYVTKPLTVVRAENFSVEEILKARQQLDAVDVVLAFSTKYDPPRNFFERLPGWERLQQRYFDFHRDLSPEMIARMLNGRIAWQRSEGGEWVAIIEIDKIRNAKLMYPQ